MSTNQQTINPEQIADRMIEAVETAQSRMIEANRLVARNIVDRFPADQVRVPALPGMPEFPAPAELVDSYFDFADRLNDANHAFARQMLTVWSPADEKATKAEKSAGKAQATKSATKKSTRKAAK